MARPLVIKIRESTEELGQRLKQATTASGKERLQMIYWLKTGQVKTRKELVKLLNRSESTITRWLDRYRQGGLNALLTVHTPPGSKPKVSPDVVESLTERLSQPKGFFNYREIQRWLAEEHNIELSEATVYKLVRYRLKAKPKVPRPRSPGQSAEEIQKFRDNLEPALKVFQELFGADHALRYFCQDESGFGLITQRGRLITLKGIKPIGQFQRKRKYFCLYGLVEPLTGERFIEKLPKMNGDNFQIFIDEFAESYSDDTIIMQLDRASFHSSYEIDWPENIIPIFQPSHAPELNPIERFWEYIKAPLRWENYQTIQQLWERIQEILAQLTLETVRSLTGWDFIVNAVLSATS